MKVKDAFVLDYDSETGENIEDGDINAVEELAQVVTSIFKHRLDSF